VAKVETIRTNPYRAAEVVDTLLKSNFIAEYQLVPPENVFFDEVDRRPDIDPLAAVLLTLPFNYSTNTARLYTQFADPQVLDVYSSLFDPKTITYLHHRQVNVPQLVAQTFRPAGYHRPLEHWLYNSQILEKKYSYDLRDFFQANSNDAPRVVRALYYKARAKSYEKPDFWGFGPKLATYAVQIIGRRGYYPLENIDDIGPPVDFLVARLSIDCNIIDLQDIPANADHVCRRVLWPFYTQFCIDHKIKPADLSERMWLLGHHFCNARRHDLCPLRSLCNEDTFSRQAYNTKGIFHPADFLPRNPISAKV
jgi:hypothetical protein